MEVDGGGLAAAAIPAIDMGGFPGELRRLKEACHLWGCFRVVNHEVPRELMAQMKAVVRELLDMPQEIKRRNTDVIAGSGYVAPSPANPLYEALGLYDVGSPEAVAAFCNQLDATPPQREVIGKYAKAIDELIMGILEKLAESLGLSRDLFSHWPCQFRINKYNFTPETVGSSGVQIHTDSGFLTILQDDETVGGLEVMDRSSGEFIPVDPWPGTFLVNLGDVAAVHTHIHDSEIIRVDFSA
ncbi:hypothetical protein SAY86_031490 [Trapa natans]|uniref:Fe2OG dioxygenase domain-containing protein n=1 Tax=Trapa natans TaxID=22666 RepID=A0AAN7M3A2_TRANT|nr:hypothetical protein SAY86_031490 [Trapa natans]